MIATTTSKKLFAILVISFLSPCIYANDFSLNQFFSLYAGQVLEGDTYAGYDEQLSTKTDNIYGIQATNSFNDSLSISGQLIISGEEDYDPKISWAYLTYEVNPFWKVRAGKLKTSFFMFSDIIDVGYTYPWIRPPIQTYSFIRYKSFGGIDSLYQHTFGDWNGLVQVYAGRINDSISFSYGSVDRSVDEMAGISWSLTYDYTLTLRAVIHTSQFSTTAPNQAVTNLLQGLEAQGYNDLSNSLKIEDERLNYYGLGAHIDTNSWVFISEYTIFDLKNHKTLANIPADSPVDCGAFSGDNMLLFTGSRDGVLKNISINNFEVKLILKINGQQFERMYSNPKSNQIIAFSQRDGMGKIHEIYRRKFFRIYNFRSKAEMLL